MKKTVKILICEMIPLVIAFVILIAMSMGEHPILSPGLSGWESRYTTLQEGKWCADPGIIPPDESEEQIDLIYGPFLSLSRGSYSVSIDYLCEFPQTFEIHSFTDDGAIMTHEEYILDPERQSITCHFTLKRPVNDLEVRVHYDGNGSVEIRNINVVSSAFLLRFLMLFYAAIIFVIDSFMLLRDLYKQKSLINGNTREGVPVDRAGLVRKTVFALAVFFVTALIAYKQTAFHSDYKTHMVWGRDVFLVYTASSTYPLWHVIDKFIYEIGHILFGMTIEYAAAITSGLVNAASYLVIERVLDKRDTRFSDIIAFTLMFVTAIYMPWYNPDIYMGQGSPNTWHSPTILMIKPFTVLGFVLIVELCDKIRTGDKVTRTEWLLLTLVLFMGVIAKPCFFQGIVPALGIFVIATLIRNRMKDFKSWLLLILTFVPAFLMVVVQFAATFFFEERGEGIGFGWMEVIGEYASHPMLSLVLVMLFPLMYVILNFKAAIKKTDIILSLLFVGCSYLEYALLYENGIRKYHGNFGWAADLSYLVAFIITAGHFFKDWETQDLSDKKCLTKNTVILTVFLLHVAFGLYYVALFLFRDGYKGFGAI